MRFKVKVLHYSDRNETSTGVLTDELPKEIGIPILLLDGNTYHVNDLPPSTRLAPLYEFAWPFRTTDLIKMVNNDELARAGGWTFDLTAGEVTMICRCLRCYHEWKPEGERRPVTCAGCGSEDWDTPNN